MKIISHFILPQMIVPKYFYLFFIILIGGCVEKNKLKGNEEKTEAISNDTIPAIRKNISKKPVATYIIPMGDPKLDRKFGVEIYETSQTFKYLLVMYYDGIIENDTLTVPNFGIWPVIKIKPGKEKLSCIISFLDVKNELREYKMLSAKNDKLKLIVLKTYAVTTYSK